MFEMLKLKCLSLSYWSNTGNSLQNKAWTNSSTEVTENRASLEQTSAEDGLSLCFDFCPMLSKSITDQICVTQTQSLHKNQSQRKTHHFHKIL